VPLAGLSEMVARPKFDSHSRRSRPCVLSNERDVLDDPLDDRIDPRVDGAYDDDEYEYGDGDVPGEDAIASQAGNGVAQEDVAEEQTVSTKLTRSS
jgi:hypothetical protein